MVKNSPAIRGDATDLSSIPGEENGHRLQYSCLENSVEWGAWRIKLHGARMSEI